MNAIRIGIMDDHPAMGMALKLQFQVCGFTTLIEADCKASLFAQLGSIEVDVLVLDILVPDASGIEVFEQVHGDFPQVKIIAYSSLGSPILVENLLEAGMRGYVNKRQNPNDVCDAVKIVAEGGIYLTDQYAFLKDRFRIPEHSLLSTREVEILRLIARELTSKEISDQLRISVFTVENHRKNIFQKLKVKNLAGAMIEAARQGYVS